MPAPPGVEAPRLPGAHERRRPDPLATSAPSSPSGAAAPPPRPDRGRAGRAYFVFRVKLLKAPSAGLAVVPSDL
jgi:hypothetical protein